ncbi:MAG: twin-arginine translocase TatA/TatE family subunit [Pirellulaceae bacterium]|nr:twin-arginine translocase TatA/TatE family subunit [Pirellulaceae bacterium]
MPTLFAIAMPGWPELIIIAVIVLLLFGNRLPNVMRSLGSSITQFKRGLNDDEADDKNGAGAGNGDSGPPPKPPA